MKLRYNGLNQLVSAYIDGVEASYSYRPDGLRHSKTVDGVQTVHIWDGEEMVAEADSALNIQNKYIRGIGLIAAEDTQGNRTGYLFNAHGDVVQLTDSSGNVTRNYDYDAFGVEREVAGNPTGVDANPFRYCGEYFDAETGSVYLRARYYDPVTGRFETEDPAMDGDNWYIYANNNPVYYSDPSGLKVVVDSITLEVGIGVYGKVTHSYVRDDHGNFVAIETFAGGGGVGAGLSWSTAVYDDLDHVYDYLNTPGFTVTVSGGIGPLSGSISNRGNELDLGFGFSESISKTLAPLTFGFNATVDAFTFTKYEIIKFDKRGVTGSLPFTERPSHRTTTSEMAQAQSTGTQHRQANNPPTITNSNRAPKPPVFSSQLEKFEWGLQNLNSNSSSSSSSSNNTPPAFSSQLERFEWGLKNLNK